MSSDPTTEPETPNYVERWEQALRVLEAMTPHEREKHFDMRFWGKQTECGTVACLAGHCSLDPWFRERGFTSSFVPDTDNQPKLQFDNVEPSEYFGERGTEYIFHSTHLSYDSVVSAVKGHIEYLKDGGDANESDDDWDYDDEF